MLITQEVEVQLNGKKIKHYEEIGYEIPKHKSKNGLRVKKNTAIKVKIEDIPKNSRLDVEVKCDYCNKSFYVRYDAYNRQKQKDIQKDCCNDCKNLKTEELNLLKYGVKNSFQRDEIKNKIKNTNIHKYGFEHPMQNKEICSKSMMNMSKNNGVETSKQQLYLWRLLGGELNHCDINTTKGYLLDIAFPNEKLYIEYNGSGHALQVIFRNITEEKFNQKEIMRYNILKRLGWKAIMINSPKDYLLKDDILLEQIREAKEWLATNEVGHSHYNIDIEMFDRNNKFSTRKLNKEELKQVM